MNPPESPKPLRARSSSRVENASPITLRSAINNIHTPILSSSSRSNTPTASRSSTPNSARGSPQVASPYVGSPSVSPLQRARSGLSGDPKSPPVILSPVMSPSPTRGANVPRFDLESEQLDKPKKVYCKFMTLMGTSRSSAAAQEEFQNMSKGTKQRTQAFKTFMKRYRVDMFNYLAARVQRQQLLEEEMAQQKLSASEKKSLREDLARRESTFLRLKRSRIKIKDFQLLSLIGRGGYGEVYLCRKIDSKEILVLKRMKKALYLTKNEVPRVQRERDVLSGSQSPWIIKLRYSFQDNDYLYLVMEYAAGGDIKTLLENLGQLDVGMTRFYFAEMILCVEYLHSLGFVHRDLKPGNFVLDKTGHLKLIDFGLSKDGINSRFKDSIQNWNTMRSSFDMSTMNTMNTMSSTMRKNRSSVMKKQRWGLAYSMVGSPEYMAPEILAREGYDERVDVWALGCCLFEMITGLTPFVAETADMVFFNVINFQDCVVRPEDEPGMTDDAWDLITHLLCDKDNRYSLDEVKRHPYFQEINWKEIRNRAPPFMPNLDDELDTSYFNVESIQEIDEESLDANFNSLLESDPNVQMYFAGFTYKRFPQQ